MFPKFAWILVLLVDIRVLGQNDTSSLQVDSINLNSSDVSQSDIASTMSTIATEQPATESTLHATTDPTPEVTTEVTPEVSTEVTPEVSTEVTPEVSTEVTPEVSTEVTPEVTPKWTPEVTTKWTATNPTPLATKTQPAVTPAITPTVVEPPVTNQPSSENVVPQIPTAQHLGNLEVKAEEVEPANQQQAPQLDDLTGSIIKSDAEKEEHPGKKLFNGVPPPKGGPKVQSNNESENKGSTNSSDVGIIVGISCTVVVGILGYVLYRRAGKEDDNIVGRDSYVSDRTTMNENIFIAAGGIQNQNSTGKYFGSLKKEEPIRPDSSISAAFRPSAAPTFHEKINSGVNEEDLESLADDIESFAPTEDRYAPNHMSFYTEAPELNHMSYYTEAPNTYSMFLQEAAEEQVYNEQTIISKIPDNVKYGHLSIGTIATENEHVEDREELEDRMPLSTILTSMNHLTTTHYEG